MIKIYRKTTNIKAEQFDGSFDMVSKYAVITATYTNNSCVYEMPTIEGMMKVKQGDWIATGVDGEHWPIADKIFKKTYAELPVIPPKVARQLEVFKDRPQSVNLAIIFSSIHELAITRTMSNGVQRWIGNYPNKFARAWLDGYRVEEDE
ncbi:DUF1642 domain-containing protein [Levilactobacillus enshiensis]|uniref:DUF1642 domain-containing protein n=1 Tax=Levilactobacillus enshiensis TaxID=2590213 RepID=UPI00117BAF31|nr:DUF1642 domain-containing protein [Levilactobacillus enshiensis]